MDTQKVIEYLDELVSSHTGKHFNDVQGSILEGVLNGQKYNDIGKNIHRSKGHIKDEGYKLWQLLSEVLDEDINKSNFRSIVDRITGTNVQINHINFGSMYANYSPEFEEMKKFIGEAENLITSVKNKTKLETIPKLLKLGLTYEQISHALDLPLETVCQHLSTKN
ncbi:MAG: hypothetical protein QNJ42_24485 [Crocosphaera sp.]|nr:hypothetical protein [Crocosphaera sp.]